MCARVNNLPFLLEACVPPGMPELEALLYDLCECDLADNSMSNTGVVKDLESILVKSGAIFSGSLCLQKRVRARERQKRTLTTLHHCSDLQPQQ